MTSVLLTGVNGVVGHPLKARLLQDKFNVYCVSRTQKSSDVNNAIYWDLQETISSQTLQQLTTAATDTLIHCAPIWLLPNHLNDLKAIGIRRIVVFSSSSVVSKRNSNDVSENQLVQQLSDSEDKLKQYCGEQDIALTIFRPSMIYGYCRDQNITHLAKFIKRYGFMFVVGQATGLRQPVHADDLVEASIKVFSNPTSFGKTYHLAGDEALTYKQMVERVFKGLNKHPRVISLPLTLFRLALKIAALSGRFSYTPEMADRMSQNLNYDNSAARTDFDYAPQTFLSRPERDLP